MDLEKCKHYRDIAFDLMDACETMNIATEALSEAAEEYNRYRCTLIHKPTQQPPSVDECKKTIRYVIDKLEWSLEIIGTPMHT